MLHFSLAKYISIISNRGPVTAQSLGVHYHCHSVTITRGLASNHSVTAPITEGQLLPDTLFTSQITTTSLLPAGALEAMQGVPYRLLLLSLLLQCTRHKVNTSQRFSLNKITSPAVHIESQKLTIWLRCKELWCRSIFANSL